MPDPVYLGLVPTIDVTVAYDAGQLLAGHVRGIGGSYVVVAEVRASNGWHRTFTLQAETTFTGRSFATTAELPLALYLQLIDDLERLINASSGPYSITVSTVVTLSGQVPGGVIAKGFSPSLSFDLSASQLRLHDPRQPAIARDRPTVEMHAQVDAVLPEPKANPRPDRCGALTHRSTVPLWVPSTPTTGRCFFCFPPRSFSHTPYE